jgi:N-acetylglucosamine-6-phosphate deacetylase
VELELCLRGGTVLTPSGFITGDVGIAGGQIAAVGSLGRAASDVDASGLHVLPGFVDVHVHGAGGSCGPTDMARFLPGTGVTAFLPTLATSSPEDTLAFLEAVSELRGNAEAEVLGSHLEGPFLSADRCGAQRREHLRAPDPREVERWLEAARGTLRRVTLAPELPGARQVVERLVEAGVQVSLGHSACTYLQAEEAVNWGASSVTHTFNAMAPFHQREPGLAGAALTLPKLVSELIADGVHVHRGACLALIRACSAASVAVVSDGLPALGLAAGRYEWQGRTVISDGAVGRLEDGTLAGSATPMVQALRNLVGWGTELAEAAHMLSAAGAALAGAGSRKGSIAEGFDADLVLLDGELRLAATYCRGELAFSSGGFRG